MDTACKHPKVRIVAREDDVEYVECLECGEVFDSEELQDIANEENPAATEAGGEGLEN
jgi:Zn ribbon nucleic-acid-binding protein